MKLYRHYIFDLDGTLTPKFDVFLLPDRAKRLEALQKESLRLQGTTPRFSMATNQGGVGLRHWMETAGFGDPKSMPTRENVEERLQIVSEVLWRELNMAYLELVCYYYQNAEGTPAPIPDYARDAKFTRFWSKNDRKPRPGMLWTAMLHHGVGERDTIYIGDREEDRFAAQNAGVDFMYAEKFFGTSRDVDVIKMENRPSLIEEQIERETVSQFARYDMSLHEDPDYKWHQPTECFVHKSLMFYYLHRQNLRFNGGYSQARDDHMLDA